MRCLQLTLTWMPIVLVAAFALPTASAREPDAPGLNDLVIYDPGTNERGLPGVVLDDREGDLKIDIPPKVHVHRYYYSGDKEFQGPIIQGGPTIVVANHPKTGERMYVDVVLPAGAPRIAYNKYSITYVYPDQRVCLKFQHFPFNPEKAVVKYHAGQGIGRTIHQVRRHMVSHRKTHLRQSQLAQSFKEAATNTGDLVHGATRSTASAASKLLDGANSVVNLIPGVTPLRSMADQRAEGKKSAEIRGADLLKRRTETPFVPTNR